MARDHRTAAHKDANAILAIILISYFMILLDNSVIFTGLPSIESGMDLSSIQLSWVQDAYTLVFGGLLLLAARAGDLVGRRRLFIIGLTIFAASSFLVGVAPAGWWLIASRAVQGIGAAIVAPTSLSLLTATFPAGPERTRAVAWYGAAAGLGASLGLVVGGALTDWVSWRAGFFINVPIGAAMVLAALRFLPETPRVRGRFDLLGALFATLGIGGLVFGTIHSSEAGWGSPVTVTAYVVGVVFLVALVVNESRAAQPIMPLRLFRSSERSGAYATRMLYLGAMIGFFFFTTQFLQGVFGFSPLEAGLAFLPMTAVNFVVAMAVPRMVGRSGNGALLAGGVAVTLVGMAWLSRVDPGDTYLLGVALPMLLIGAGQGMAFAPLTSAGISGVTGEDAGAASGLVNTAHQLGSTLGIAILVAIAANPGDAAPTRMEALADRVDAALTGGTGLLALALVVVITFILPKERRARRAHRAEQASVSGAIAA
ncbi:MFS transporter [Jatrophihabitans sp.]|uniref:MFS transporter n=1 Tax=Jatrophihabitans sp. TaxID=1932789 RepID=UPI0030C6E418|nr:transporter [Jatrophihabitans sp.]